MTLLCDKLRRLGLSVDFAIHYGVTFATHRKASDDEVTGHEVTGQQHFRSTQAVNNKSTKPNKALESARHAFQSVFTAISMAALTTFFAGKNRGRKVKEDREMKNSHPPSHTASIQYIGCCFSFCKIVLKLQSDRWNGYL